ncbi:MAG: DUF11 domain-containing protein, partial [Elioraea sp.]|nr:DUF11 domain-containing protein [Elioraea sp.]
MTMHARSSQPSRRPRALLIALALLTLLALLIGLFPPPDGAQAQGVPGFRVRITYSPPDSSASSPGSGWVAAERISFSGCIDRGNFGDCFGQTERTTGLYEHRPVRRSVGRSYDPARPPAPSPIFSGLDRQPCIAGGVFQFWPAGKWHFGGRWTRTVSYGQLEYRGSEVILPVTVSWSQVGTHAWAFYPDDECPTTPIVTRTPTPPVGGPPTATPPGGGPPRTPPPETPTIPVTPTPPPTATPGICYEGSIHPMPLALYEGQIPFDGSNINPPFTVYAGRYIGNDPERYYDGNTDNAYTYQTPEDYYAMLPERHLWVPVRPNRIVEARFDLERTSFSRPDAPVQLGVFDINPLRTRGREMVIVLQDLGNDRRPSGDDTLLAFLALSDADPYGMFGGRQVLRVRDTRDTPPDNIAGRPGVGGQPAFQAVLRPGILADFTGRIFSWAGNPGPEVPPTSWPVPLGAMPARDWLWPPHPSGNPNVWGPSSALSLRFATQPNRVYRMFAFTKTPMCDTEVGAVAQLVFHTLGDADMAIEKSAPAEAVREEQIAYSLTARNIGTTAAQDVVVADTLPDGVTFVSADPPPSSVNGRTLTWNLGAVDAGAARSIALMVDVLASAPDALTNVGEVRASNDGNAANNRAEATTSLVRTNVAVRMTAT